MRIYRVLQFGCGPIGCRVARLASGRANVEIVGAVDIAKDKIGRDLGEVAEAGRRLGVTISGDAARSLGDLKPDVAIHTTGSDFGAVYAQLELIVSSGTNVVSTCEELSFPYHRHREKAAELDKLARANGVSVLATGINPGFLMDAWPLFMTGVCMDVRMITATRIQDATSRRLPFQKKIGAGCTVREFQRRVDEGSLRHVGLTESIAMIGDTLGWKIDRITESIEPIIAQKRHSSEYLIVEPGQVAGVRQIGCGFEGELVRVLAEFQASLGAADPYDEVYISGTPELRVRIPGGTHGDIGTAAMVVNALPRVVEAAPGLLTMRDLPMVVCTAAGAGA